jgi:hypothetical protein
MRKEMVRFWTDNGSMAAGVGVQFLSAHLGDRLAGDNTDRARRTHTRSRKHCDPGELHTLTVVVEVSGRVNWAGEFAR